MTPERLSNAAGYADRTDVRSAPRFLVHLSRTMPAFTALAAALLVTGCAAKGGVPRPFPGAALPPGAGVPSPTPETAEPSQAALPPVVPPVSQIVATALTFRGTPYRNGGSDPSGFDCSGFVQWVFAQHGTPLPREVRDQYRAGRKLDDDDVQPGDLVFFETVSKGASHVGIAIGNGQFVHAPSSRGVVRVERYTGSYWAERWVGARRVAADVTSTK
jgi:cell wall-associated NlpC family hydrolase